MCCQLLKAWGAHVTVTCSHNAEGLVRGLGADEVVDYTAGDAATQLEVMEKYVFEKGIRPYGIFSFSWELFLCYISR